VYGGTLNLTQLQLQLYPGVQKSGIFLGFSARSSLSRPRLKWSNIYEI